MAHMTVQLILSGLNFPSEALTVYLYKNIHHSISQNVLESRMRSKVMFVMVAVAFDDEQVLFYW